MKSGDFSISRNDEYYRKSFSEIKDSAFEQCTFFSHGALVSKEPVNGWRMWKEYDGEPYDQTKFDLVEEMWDHEHCSVCYFTIRDDFTYWQNAGRIQLLCDACYETFSKLKSKS